MFKNLYLIINRLLNYFSKFISPGQLIGGLEIGDSDLKFVLIKDNKLISASLKLPAGVVESGKIKDKAVLKTILNKLHSQVSSGFRKKDKVCVVVNIPDTDIYIQTFNLPMLAPESVEEAAKLNLQMISPIDFAGTYADWQEIGEVDIDGGQLEILGVFAPRQIIDDLVECLKDANFIVTAVEFSSLAIGRLASGLSYLPDFFLLLNLNGNGLSFGLIKNNNLYFNHFIPWPIGEDRQISFDVVKEIIIQETRKVLNFAGNHWPKSQLGSILVVAPSLDEKISQIIKENFSLSVQKLILPSTLASAGEGWSITNSQLSSFSPNWFGVLGSALRGLIPRQKDRVVSLTGSSPIEEFRQQQIINFIKIWRNIVLASLSFIFLIFLAVEIFLISAAGTLSKQLGSLPNSPEIEEAAKLQAEAKKFNQEVALIADATKDKIDWSSFLVKMNDLAGRDIVIKRISVQSLDAPVLFSGQAKGESGITAFKGKLEEDPAFKEIDLPLSSVKASPDGTVDFSMNFKLVPANLSE